MAVLVIHPGAPKTATSTLQHVLRENRSRLSESGVGLILPEDIRGKPFLGHYLSAYRGSYSGPLIDQVIADFFGPFLNRYGLVICSEETFCHDHMPSRKFGRGGIDRSDVAADLLSKAGASKINIVLSIRPQVDLLVSTYTHFVHRHREVRDFSNWLAGEVSLPDVLWQPAVAAFQGRFGCDSVRVVSLDTVRKVSMEAYVQSMLHGFGVNFLEIEMPAGKVHNPSPSQRAVHLCCIMNKEINHPQRSEVINTALVETFPVSEFGRYAPEAWRLPDDIKDLYATDHAACLGLNFHPDSVL